MHDPALEQGLVSEAKLETFVFESNTSQVSQTGKPTIIIRSREQTTFIDVVSSVFLAGTGIAISYWRGGMHLVSLAGSTY